jgi:branched-chain amino acid transport system substrate-binding protein
MRTKPWSLHAAWIAFVLSGFAAPAHAQTVAPQPYASIAIDGERYAGPGRASANDLLGEIIRIGLLAPLYGLRTREGDAMLFAAQLALHDAAPHGLVRGRRVELAVEDASGPSWGMVSDAIIRLVLKDSAIAVITSTSGTDAHLVEQVSNRIGVPVLTFSADATTTEIDIPWIFRMGASDTAEARLIAHDIYSVRKLHNVLLITQQGHDGDRGLEAMRQAAAEIGAPEPNNVAHDKDHPELLSAVNTVQEESPQAVVLWTDSDTTARLLPALQVAGMKALCYLSQNASAGIDAVSPIDRASMGIWTTAADGGTYVSHQSFASRFQETTGARPTRIAAETYDAVILTVHALRVAGPNRARVRDQLSRVQAYDGASGQITFDREGNDLTPLHLVKIVSAQPGIVSKSSPR